jgi:hypothetical protein
MEFPAEDIERSKAFWNGLFGWEFGDPAMPDMDYRMAKVSESCGVAIFEQEERGHPNVYLDTDDIDAAMERARELGGSAEEKAPVPGHGWFARCQDSEGNAFHLWQSDESAAPASD